MHYISDMQALNDRILFFIFYPDFRLFLFLRNLLLNLGMKISPSEQTRLLYRKIEKLSHDQ
jgi:hypothetical protein